jgi:thioredoxin 1
MEPILNELSSSFASSVETIRVNADEEPALAAELRVYSIPTIVVMQNGAEIARRVGAQSKGDLTGLYESVAAGAPIAAVSNRARIFRIAVAAAIMLASTEARVQWPFYAAAGGVFFSAIHDRCPIWQAVKRLFQPAAG